MARRQSHRGRPSMPEDNEIDSFHKNQEKILLDEAGEYGNARDESDEEEEEVLGVDEQDDEDSEEDDSEEEEQSGDDEEIEEGWGRKSNYYGGDEDEGIDPEASKAMTEEAIRQQKKNLKELGMEDYIDDDMMADWDKKAEEFDTETSKTLVINDANTDMEKLDSREKLELLTESFPEFVPLLTELNTLKPLLGKFGDSSSEILGVKKVALTAYLGAIASYFSIFLDQMRNGDEFSSMREHPVMETILTTRQVWKEADGLGSGDISGDVEEEVSQEVSSEDEFIDAKGESSDEEELGVSGEDQEESEESGEESEESSESDDDMEIDVTTKRNIKDTATNNVHDYLEANTPDEVDDEDKQKRKKSLRFYTSKIDQAQIRNNEKMNGDEDLPYKERLFERKQRLLEEARKRGLGEGTQQAMGEDLDGDDMNSEDEQLMHEINDEDDSYYESMKSGKQTQKDARKQAHKEATRLAKEGKLAEAQELIGNDGKRAINYQILKNKGLTSKKKKDLRNARVKKRKKYDQAKKKVKSVRAVYSGENKGPYEGEKTGIKKGLSKSVKLV